MLTTEVMITDQRIYVQDKLIPMMGTDRPNLKRQQPVLYST